MLPPHFSLIVGLLELISLITLSALALLSLRAWRYGARHLAWAALGFAVLALGAALGSYITLSAGLHHRVGLGSPWLRAPTGTQALVWTLHGLAFPLGYSLLVLSHKGVEVKLAAVPVFVAERLRMAFDALAVIPLGLLLVYTSRDEPRSSTLTLFGYSILLAAHIVLLLSGILGRPALFLAGEALKAAGFLPLLAILIRSWWG